MVGESIVDPMLVDININIFYWLNIIVFYSSYIYNLTHTLC